MYQLMIWLCSSAIKFMVHVLGIISKPFCYQLLKALKISPLCKIHIVQFTCKIFFVEYFFSNFFNGCNMMCMLCNMVSMVAADDLAPVWCQGICSHHDDIGQLVHVGITWYWKSYPYLLRQMCLHYRLGMVITFHFFLLLVFIMIVHRI